MHYATIAVNTAVHKTFHYHIPDALDGLVHIGQLVRVSFATAMLPGIVIAIADTLPPELADIQTKPIIELLHPEPVMTQQHIDLALWMSDTYMTSPGACLWLMLPPGITGSSTKYYYLLDPDATGNTDVQNVILEALHEKSPQPLNALKKLAKPQKKVLEALKQLQNRGTLRVEASLSAPTVAQKTVRTVENVVAAEDLIEIIDGLKRAKKQKAVFAYIAQQDYPLDVSDIREATGATHADLNKLAEKNLIAFGERIVYRDSLADRDFIPSQPLQLTQGQQAVWEKIRLALDFRPYYTFDPTLTLPAGREGTVAASEEYSEDNERLSSSTQNLVADELTENHTTAPPPSTGEVGRRSEWAQFERWQTPAHLWYKLRSIARQMRREPTVAENYLWDSLRRRKIDSVKFRRQHVIGRFIVDFYAPDAKLIIEVDGAIHQYTQEEDTIRQVFLEAQGYRVLRFTNEQVMTQRGAVLDAIRAVLVPSPTHWERELGSTENNISEAAEKQSIERESVFLLHGVTGSGKTEVYLHAIADVLRQGRQAIFLVPEIALTPQTIRRVAQRFPGKVAVIHSGLTPRERYDTWQRARQGDIGVIVGTRSALFTPLPNIGLVILDEEHDHSYKQTPPIAPPYYHARDVAEKMMQLNNGVMILGSATPDVSTYYRAQAGDLTYLHLPSRIMGHRQRIEKQSERTGVTLKYEPAEGNAMSIGLPPVRIVDMREELMAGNRSMFSRELQHELNGVLERGEQAILFLNRRGQATYVFCRDCGTVVTCDRCDTPMTYHRHGEDMRCHHCSNTAPAPTKCSNCGSSRIKYFGAGTQQIEQALIEMYPDARFVRWDADTASKPDHHESILAKFANGEADVMIGTQMIAKGLDLPLVTLVGVVSADPGLALPDFRADERAFQLLTQVAGRAGRGILGGQVIIQTYQPQHPSIIAAADHDYEQFFAREIEARRQLGYPPFRRLGRVLVQNTHPIEAQREIDRVAALVKRNIAERQLTDTHLIGPAPCFFSRIDRQYRWQILVRSADPLRVLQGLQIKSGWYMDIDPIDIL